MFLGRWILLATCNWEDVRPFVRHRLGPTSLGLDYLLPNTRTNMAKNSIFVLHFFEFWSQRYVFWLLKFEHGKFSFSKPSLLTPALRWDEKIVLHPVRRHSAFLYSIRISSLSSCKELESDLLIPLFLGSNLHFTCGNELLSLRVIDNKLLADYILLFSGCKAMESIFASKRRHCYVCLHSWACRLENAIVLAVYSLYSRSLIITNQL
jgi:hypothetical protein